jgi:predicted RNase H-like HicB family nuclease
MQGYNLGMRLTGGSEIIFSVEEAPEGGYVASALGFGITTQAETLEELRQNVREAVDCFFDDDDPARPRTICLRMLQEEIFAA